MSSTYLSSKRIIDSLLANPQFVNLAKTIVNSIKGSKTYLETYDELNVLLKSLGITVRVTIIKSDGLYSYINTRTPDDPVFNENQNTDIDVFSAINYAFGNPICNKKLYPLDLQSSVCSGYGFSSRHSSVIFKPQDFTSKTYKPTSNPLSTDVFTIRIIQNQDS